MILKPPVFEAHPSIKKIKNDLYEIGAIYASMSGSGSTVFGIFNKTDEVSQHTFPAKLFSIKNCFYSKNYISIK